MWIGGGGRTYSHTYTTSTSAENSSRSYVLCEIHTSHEVLQEEGRRGGGGGGGGGSCEEPLCAIGCQAVLDSDGMAQEGMMSLTPRLAPRGDCDSIAMTPGHFL